MKNLTFSKESMSVAALLLLAVFGLAGCGGGGDTNTTSSEPTALAAQITEGATAEEVVAATQKALTLSGTPIGDLDQIYSPATEPAASGFISPRAAFNMAMEEHNRATSGRLTVTELGLMLKDFGWPFKGYPSPGAQMMAFFSAWVTEAQKDPANPQSFAPLFIYEMAKLQVPPVDLASGTGDPDLMRLTLLELEIFTSAFDRASKATTSPLSPKMTVRAAAAQAGIVTDPCSQMKTSFGQWGRAAAGFVLEQGTGEIMDRALKAGMDEAVAEGIGNALSAVGTAARIWKLVQIYSSAEVSLAIEGGDQVHKPLEGTRLLKKITATAGIPAQDWQAYQTNMAARGDGGKIEQAVKDCMQTFGFPTLSDLGEIASSIDSWRVGWEFRGGECGSSYVEKPPSCLAYFDFGADHIPPFPPGIVPAPPYRQDMIKTGAASAQAVVSLNISEEKDADHNTGIEKTGVVNIKTSALTAEPPSLSTFVNAAKGGLGLIDSLVEFGGGWLQTMFPPSSTIPLTVTYHYVQSAPSATAGDTQTTVRWSRVSGATATISYNIYWSTTPGVTKTTGTKITGVTSPYTHTGLTNGITYYYVVTAVDYRDGEGSESSQASATPMPVPKNLAVTAVSSSQLNLSWSASTDAVGVTGYKIYRGATYLKSVAGTSSSDTGLTELTQYCYEVTAYNAANNESGKSAQVCATTLDGTRPTVVSTSPAAGATDAGIIPTIMVTFSKAMDPATITTAALTVSGKTVLFAYYHAATNTAEFTLSTSLARSTDYTAAINPGLKDTMGNDAQAYTWSFRTADASPSITAFSFTNPAVTGTISEIAKTISVTVPAGTNVTALIASFTTTGASVQVGATVQTSGVTANDFTSPVAYTVTAADSSTAVYTVTVTVPVASVNKNNFQDVVWSGTQFVAVGLSGTIITSPDGATWTARTSGTTRFLLGVTWSGTQFVAVGQYNSIITSSDGATWTVQIHPIGVGADLYAVTWSGTQFVAVGLSGTIITSPDGATWTARTSGTIGGLLGVTWSGSQFVAVGSSGTILTSPDGIAWTAQAPVIYHSDIRDINPALTDVIWSGTQFVAVGNYDSIFTSPNGIAWTYQTRAIGTGSQFLYDVTWSGTQFVAVGATGTIITSSDGATWTVQTHPSVSHLHGVTWSGTQFVALGYYGIITSPDGVTWTLR